MALWILLISLISCKGNVEESRITKSAVEISPDITRRNEVTELEYYAKDMQKFAFHKYPSGKCKRKLPAVAPDLSQLQSLPENIKQRIKMDYESDKGNFNCKFKVISWGCGSPCQMAAIFDTETGKLVGTLVTSFGVDFKTDSRLLIQNPPLNTTIDSNYRKTMGEPVYWEIYNGRLRKL